MSGLIEQRSSSRRYPLHGALMAAALLGAGATGCTEGEGDRTGEIASVMARADMPLLRTRPELVAGKYALMASDPYSFYRGSVPIYLHDYRLDRDGAWTTPFMVEEPLVLTLGDAHVENFGTLLSADGTFALEPNDFDAADEGVYLWDVRRLVIGAALAARLSNEDDSDARDAAAAAARDIAASAAKAYVDALGSLADGGPRERLSEPGDGPVLKDLFERSASGLEERSELADLTVMAKGTRIFKRGAIDPTNPTSLLYDLPGACKTALPEVLGRYRETLSDPPPPSFFEIQDMVRELGSGVASFPRVRVLVLLRGDSDSPDDDVLLEVKEIADAIGPSHAPSDVRFDSLQDRIQRTTRAAWATATTAPLWSTSSMLGFPVQVRLVSGGQRTVRVGRLFGKRGTPEAISDLAAHLGALLARVHASPLPEGAGSKAADLWSVIGRDPEGFVAEQADAGAAGAERVLEDYGHFRDALDDLGPTLGVVPAPGDAPSPELAQLYSGISP
ncbi:MAG: DUF2252 family protein [Polyangiaceae bacterium]